MEKFRNLDYKEAEKLRATFNKSVELTKTVFGERAFKRINNITWSRKRQKNMA